MNTWARKTGYPVVKVLAEEDRGAQGHKCWRCQQTRFLSSGKTFDDSDADQNPTWNIPVARGKVVSGREFTVDAPNSGKLNEGQHCIFRVLYTEDQWRQLIRSVGALSDPLDRWALGNDAFTLSKAGMLKPEIALEMVAALGRAEEADIAVWSEVTSAFSSFMGLLSGSSALPALEKLIKKTLKPAFDRVGFAPKAGEPTSDALTRSSLLGLLCIVQDEETIETCKHLFENRATTPVHPDLRSAVYGTMVRSFGEVDALLKILKESTQQEEQVRCIRGFGCTRDVAVMNRVLDFALDEDIVRSQDIYYLVNTVATESAAGRSVAWSWIKKNWPEMVRRYGESGSLLGRVIQGSLSGSTDDSLRQDLAAFIEAHPLESIHRTMKQTLEAMESNVRWKARDYDAVASWLAKTVQ
eukprot:ANDGO_08026.mRNA.1 Aminopeptidase M1-A